MTQRRFWIHVRLFSALTITSLAAAPGRAPGATFTQITADTTKETDPTPSPDGKWIAFTSDRGGHGATQLYLMPVEGGAARQITNEPDSAHAGTPSWAPDSKSLLFVSTRGKRFNIYSIPVEGGTARQMARAPGNQRFAAYSPDGKQIVFYSNRVRPNDLYGFNIYVMDSSGETATHMARQVTDSRGSPGHPTWSADGNWIGFVAKEYDPTRQQTIEGNIIFAKYQVYKVPSRGGKITRLTRGTVDGQSFEDTWPSWSPDGKWIAFGRQVGGKGRDIWVLEVATNKAFAITKAGNCIKPTWGPDSKSIYYSTSVVRNEDLWVARDLDLKPPASTKKPAVRKSRAKPRAAAHESPTRTTLK